MKKKIRNTPYSGIFLIELMLSILFLALCSAVCVRLFVKSSMLSQQSHHQTQAVTVCQNIAEIFEACTEHAAADETGLNIVQKRFMDYFPDAAVQNKGIDIYFDGSFKPCRYENASYTASVRLDFTYSLMTADILFIKQSGDSCIYELNVSQAVLTGPIGSVHVSDNNPKGVMLCAGSNL